TRAVFARATAVAFLCGLIAATAPNIGLAIPISFDPDGVAAANGTLSVSSIDFLPGNTLFRGLGTLLVNKANQPVEVYAQTRIGSLLDANSLVIPVNGLNTAFELTLVLGFSATGTVDTVITPTHPFPTATVSLAANPPVNFAEL